jgi:hypothetical protein
LRACPARIINTVLEEQVNQKQPKETNKKKKEGGGKRREEKDKKRGRGIPE